MRLRPDVIVVDVGMPLLNGLDAARRIKEQAPNIKFIFLTMREDPNLAAAALELGPIGFVLKHSTGQELLKAIDHVLHGKPYITPKLRAEDWVATKARARQFSRKLTPRQREIVQLFAEGDHEGNRRIAEHKREDCGISQAPHHGSVQPSKQRRHGLVCLEARIDFAKALTVLREYRLHRWLHGEYHVRLFCPEMRGLEMDSTPDVEMRKVSGLAQDLLSMSCMTKNLSLFGTKLLCGMSRCWHQQTCLRDSPSITRNPYR